MSSSWTRVLREAGGMGDVVTTFPVAIALKLRFPDCRVAYFALPYYAPLARLCPAIDMAIEVPPATRRPRLATPDPSRFPYLDRGPCPNGDYQFTADCWCPAPPYESQQFTRPLNRWPSRITIFLHYNGLYPGMPGPETQTSGDEARRLAAAFFRSPRPPGQAADWLTPRAVIPPDLAAWAERSIRERGLGRKPLIAVQPFTSTTRRNWPFMHVRQLCERLIEHGLQPMIFDSGRTDGAGKRRTDALPGERACGLPLDRAAALVARCQLVVTPDTGMLHLAAALDVPTVALCGPTLGTALCEFYPKAVVMQRAAGDFPAPRGCLYPCWNNRKRGRETCKHNCAALAALGVEEVLAKAIETFETHYQQRIPPMAPQPRPQKPENPFVVAAAAHKPIALAPDADGEAFYRYYRDDRGFDAAVKGGWQANYAQMLDRAIGGLDGHKILDVGTAMGALASALRDRGADIYACELLPWFIEHSPFDNLRGRLFAADACDLSLLNSGQFTLIHASQVYEHVPPDRIELAFSEAFRLLAPGGILLAAFPEFADNPPTPDPDDDVTHICLRPRAWWTERLRAAGFVLGGAALDAIEARLAAEPMAIEYRWGILLAQRPSGTAAPGCGSGIPEIAHTSPLNLPPEATH